MPANRMISFSLHSFFRRRHHHLLSLSVPLNLFAVFVYRFFLNLHETNEIDAMQVILLLALVSDWAHLFYIWIRLFDMQLTMSCSFIFCYIH